MWSTGRPESWERRAKNVVKNTTIPRRQLDLTNSALQGETHTFNRREFKSSPQDKLGSGTSPPTQLKAGTLSKNLQHVEWQAKVLARFGSVGDFDDNPHAMICFSKEEVYSHIGRVVEGAVGNVSL